VNDIEIITSIQQRMDAIAMQLTLFYSVVERTGRTTEGYFSLRKINELTASGMTAMAFGPESYLQHLDNVAATIATETARIES
jgi:hypothetical protein